MRIDCSTAVIRVAILAGLCTTPLSSQVSQPSSQFAPPFSLHLEVLSKANESELRFFVENMYKTVKTRAMNTLPSSVLHGEQAVVTVEFQVQKDGSLGHSAPLTIVGDSGKKALEKHAQAAIRSAAPFGALPNSAPAPLQLRLTFYYNTAPPNT
jgi:TonB family protein